MKYKDLNDYELLYFVEDNEDNREILFKKYRPLIVKLSSRYYNACSYIGLEYCDFYQEAYLAFLTAIDTYNETQNALFYTYVYVCMNRQLQNLIRENSSNKKRVLNEAVSINQPLNDNLTYEDLLGNSETDPYFILEKGSIYKMINEIIYTLKDNQICIWQLYINGYKQTEIAKLLEISNQSVSNNLRIAKNKIQEVFN